MKITIVSPAKTISSDLITKARQLLEKSGFKVSIALHASNQHNYFAGTDTERLHDLQQALDDNETDFILCSKGGYGTIRLMSQLDFSQYIKYPKPIIGFSDITVLHNKMRLLDLPAIHGVMPGFFKNNTPEAIQSLINALKGLPNIYIFPAHSCNKKGAVTAPVTGGNLSIYTSLLGTPLETCTDNHILFLEDIDEAIYEVERMFWQLKMAGKLKNLKGLIIGGMTKIKDTVIPFGQTVEEVIARFVADYTYPLCFNFPAGHISDNRAIILGKEATVNISDHKTTFIQ